MSKTEIIIYYKIINTGTVHRYVWYRNVSFQMQNRNDLRNGIDKYLQDPGVPSCLSTQTALRPALFLLWQRWFLKKSEKRMMWGVEEQKNRKGLNGFKNSLWHQMQYRLL